MVAVGLIATLAAAALANENLSGDAAQLEWVQMEELADSQPAAIPGGGAPPCFEQQPERTRGTASYRG